MVEYNVNLDLVFFSIADPTRRNILEHVAKESHSVGELAQLHKNLSFAAVAKHISVLEDSQLIIKKRQGKYQVISINQFTLNQAMRVLQKYKAIWESRFNALDSLLK